MGKCGAESRAHSLRRRQIVLKKLRASLQCLRLINEADLVGSSTAFTPLQDGEELAEIIATSIVTMKGK